MVSVYFYTLFYFEERRFNFILSIFFVLLYNKNNTIERRFLCLKKQQFKERFQVQ